MIGQFRRVLAAAVVVTAVASTAFGAGQKLIRPRLAGDPHYAKLDQALISSIPSDDYCNPGPAKTAFLTTDVQVYLYLAVSSVAVGDRLDVEWVRPDGTIYSKHDTWTASSSGNWCFDRGIKIAGNSAANYTGTWSVRSYWNSTLISTLTWTLSAPGGGTGGGTTGGLGQTLTIDAKANIYASGRATAFDGVLPPSVRLPSGTGRVITLSNVSGQTGCAGQNTIGPDGTGFCVSDSMNITSYKGISGIKSTGRVMYLVGVFLDDTEPQDPAPPTLDVTDYNTRSVISPLLKQVFFMGDGLTSSGVRQQFIAPDTATRLFLGYADAGGFSGSPGYYGDNWGSLTATVEGGTGGGTGGTNLVTNGDFELPGTGQVYGVAPGNSLITGWTVTRADVDYIISTSSCASGKACIDMDGWTPGAISQTISTTAGQTYTLTFDMAGNVDGSSKVKQMRVQAAGTSQDFSFDATGKTWSNMGWQTKSLVFAATGSSTTIAFSSLGPSGSSYGPFLDNVRVTAGGAGGGTGAGTGTTLTIDAKSNIYASGRATAFEGVLPPSVRLPSGTGRVITLSNVSGQTGCNGQNTIGPDGVASECGASATNVGSYKGISGIKSTGRVMYLVGVFLDDTEPQDPPPATLDVTDYNTRSAISPLLRQVFFMGDGLTSTGVRQQFMAPDGATRLFLGFADSYSFNGSPCCYADNWGSLTATVEGATAGGGTGGGTGGASTGNLIQNPGAEAGPENCSGQTNIPSWTGNGAVAVCKYGGDVPATSPGPSDRGNQYFSGGYQGTSVISQTIDLSSYASQIDGGSQGYTLSGWLGGWDGQDDNAKLKVEFKNSSGTALGSSEIGPVLTAERKDVTGMILKTTSGTVPASARSAVVTLTITRTSGSYNDGIADNLSLVLGAGGGTGGGTGGGANITRLVLEGGSGTFSGNGQIWDTIAGNSIWFLGVTAPSPNAAFLNNEDSSINIAGGTYWLYGEPTSLGTSVRLTVTWSNGTEEHAVFAVGSLNVANTWTRLAGSSNITLGSSGYTEVNRIGSTSFTASGSKDFILQMGVPGPGTGTGGGTGGGTTPGCNYLVQPTSITGVSGNGGTSVIRVTTGLNCSWQASSSVNWIAIRSGTEGTGNGAIEIVVAQNPSTTSPRIGVVTVAGQAVSVSQDPAPSCSYSLSPTSASAPAGGTSGSVTVTVTGSGCSWSATSNAGWISVTSTSGNVVSYSVQANPNTTSRSGSITIAGLTFTVTQEAGGSVPTISSGGIVNAASYAAGANGLARGSFVSIFGTNIGPAQFQQASYPLPTTLAGVRVTFSQGFSSVDAYLVFVSSSQINAIIPSTVPTGNVNATVTYQGMTSAAAPVLITDPSLGIFFQRQGGRDIGVVQNVYSSTNYPLNLPSQPAEPGMPIVVWATGMGSSGRSENNAPGAYDMKDRMNITARIDGLNATVLYAGTAPEFAGTNNIYVQVPQGVRYGCYIPLEITIGGRTANQVLIAISTDRGTPCTP